VEKGKRWRPPLGTIFSAPGTPLRDATRSTFSRDGSSLTPYRFLPHTADVAVELLARSELGLYQAGLDALRELLVGASLVTPAVERAIEPRGADPTERLIHFLADALYLWDTERFLPAKVTSSGIAGEPFDPARHQAQREVKAVTHHGAEVRVEQGGYHTTIVFDV
jgi:SHS2 domain-containing protein